jgi:hypothetical protein
MSTHDSQSDTLVSPKAIKPAALIHKTLADLDAKLEQVGGGGGGKDVNESEDGEWHQVHYHGTNSTDDPTVLVRRTGVVRRPRTPVHHRRLPMGVAVMILMASVVIGSYMLREAATPHHPPAFDIHSPEASIAWIKYHAGAYKDQVVVDLRASLADRAAALVANHAHDLQLAKYGLVEYRDIGMHKLGLSEPTWTEWAWAKLTGQPITWRERVRHIVKLAKQGIALQKDRSIYLATYMKNRALYHKQ